MKFCTINLCFLAFWIQLVIWNSKEFIWSMSNSELNFLIFEETYSPNNVYSPFSTNWVGSFWGWLKQRNIFSSSFSMYFSQDFFSLFLLFFHRSFSLQVCDGLFCKNFGSPYFGLFSGKPIILSLQNFHLMNSGFLDYQSRQIGHHRLINYHPNLILTVLFSYMNLAKTNI